MKKQNLGSMMVPKSPDKFPCICEAGCVDCPCAWEHVPGFQKSSIAMFSIKRWCFPLVGSVLKLNLGSVHPSEWFCKTDLPGPDVCMSL